MPTFTVFYSHPRLCREGGSYVIVRPSARVACEEAVDMLASDLDDECDVDEEADAGSEESRVCEASLDRVRDDLEVRVYLGEHGERPRAVPCHEWT